MQIFTLLLTLSFSILFAQDYPQGKIDMHGGKYDNYKNIGGFKDAGFAKPFGSMSKFLDKNTSTLNNENDN